MVDGIRMFWIYAGASIRTQMQYRASFLLAMWGQFFATGIEFLVLGIVAGLVGIFILKPVLPLGRAFAVGRDRGL